MILSGLSHNRLAVVLHDISSIAWKEDAFFGAKLASGVHEIPFLETHRVFQGYVVGEPRSRARLFKTPENLFQGSIRSSFGTIILEIESTNLGFDEMVDDIIIFLMRQVVYDAHEKPFIANVTTKIKLPTPSPNYPFPHHAQMRRGLFV